MHIVDIISAIASAKTAKAKEAIIMDNAQNPLLRAVLHFTLDEKKTYHFKKFINVAPEVTLFKGVNDSRVEVIKSMFIMLLEFNSRGSAPAAEIVRISERYALLNIKDQEMFDMILSRKIKCGAGLSKWRLAFGESFCPAFPCYLSSAFDEDGVNKGIFGGKAPYAFSELKSDGQRAMAIISSSEPPKIYSRKGNQYHGLVHIENLLSRFNVAHLIGGDNNMLGDMTDFVLDGELVLLDEYGDILNRQTGNGRLSKFIGGTGKDEDSSRALFVVWDLIPLDEFYGSKDYNTTPLYSRIAMRDTYINALLQNVEGTADENRISIQRGRRVDGIGEAMSHYVDMVALGEEGTILKRYDAVYDPCPNELRPSTMFKFKMAVEANFKIVGFEFGKKNGKYATAIGGFLCKSADGLIKFTCGGGLTDELRFTDGNDHVGKIINVKFNCLTKAKGKTTHSVQHPRMVSFVDDSEGSVDDYQRVLDTIAAKVAMGAVMKKAKK